MSEGFNDGSIVGEEIGKFLFVCLTQQRCLEHLGSLHQFVFTAGNRLAACWREVTDGFKHIYHRNGCTRTMCLVVATLDDFDRDEGTNTIVHSHQFHIGMHFGKSVLHRMETGCSAIGYGEDGSKGILLAEFSPVVLLVFGQNEHDLHGGVELKKALDGMHQDGFAVDGKELFGDIASHAQSLSTGYDDDGVHARPALMASG